MDHITTLKRPRPTDDEKKILRMQVEFLQNKQQPAAKVINLRNQKEDPIHPSSSSSVPLSNLNANVGIKSRFSTEKKLKRCQERLYTSETSGEEISSAFKEKISEVESQKSIDFVQNIPIAPANIILGNIVEKNYHTKHYELKINDATIADSSDTGFPGVFISDQMEGDKKHSLFWKKMSKNKPLQDVKKMEINETPTISKVDHTEDILATEIHNENMQKIGQMSEEEILKEKASIEAMLNPDLIQFLKDRKKNKNVLKENKIKDVVKETQQKNILRLEEQKNFSKHGHCESSDSHETVIKEDGNVTNSTAVDNVILSNVPKPPVEIFKQAKEMGWVHMDSIEPEKLEWMEEIPVDKNDKLKTEEPYNARFDFSGLLLPYKDENVTIEKGLHHHGEEPERPGYSLQELLQLSRSSTQQQRCTALTTIANIIEKSRNGWYDKALQPAPLIALSERNILLLLRFSLDDTSVAVVTATLQALRAYMYSEADEICLDRLYGWDKYKEPTLMPPSTDVKDTRELKDHELAKLDVVAAALRSDIILRIRYILSEMYPSPIGVTSALEILIRLARHSHVTALNIASTPHLLEIIVQHFIPISANKLVVGDTISSAYGVPIISAIRLCRILVCYGGKPVAVRLSNTKIIHSILSYITSDTGKGGINLSIEGLRLWKALLLHEVASESIAAAELIFVSQLQLLLSNFDIGNTSELACEHAAALIAVSSHITSLKSNISILLLKWSTQLASITSPTWGIMKLIALTLLVVNDISMFKCAWISNSNIFTSLCSTSNLLSGYNIAAEREPTALPSCNVLTEDGQLQPIVSKHSCIAFLSTVLNVLYNHSCITEIQLIFNQRDFCKYLKQLEKWHWSLESLWYTRMELFLLTITAKCVSIIKHGVDTEIMNTIWKITVKLISVLPGDTSHNVKELLQIALSNEKLRLDGITQELANLNLNTNGDDVNINIVHNVTSVYERYITLNEDSNQAAMPKDWIYLPLVHIYSHCKNNGACNVARKKTILTVLSLELALPELVEELSPSLRFSRLILVYLCDVVYLEKDVSILLSKVISNLVHKYHKKLDFASELPGLNSFTDLFTAMCEHFCATSYGDHSFATTLLVPIAQKHDVHYRKLLWSEHAGVLRYMGLPVEKLIVPLREYLYPIEEDTSLIECYLTALVRGTIREEWCSIPYTIALHHSAMYLKRTTKLAMRMRAQIQKIQNTNLTNILLHYESKIL